MKTILRWTIRIGLMLLLAALVLGLWKREEIARLWAVNTLFDESRIVANFSHMDRAFLTVPVARGDAPVSQLPPGAAMTLPEGAAEWLEARSVTSLLVLHDGHVVHESYHLGFAWQFRTVCG